MTYFDTDYETYYKNEEFDSYNCDEDDILDSDFEIDYEYFEKHECCYPWGLRDGR